jgi:NAD-dependent SIR2 family protein deacetylase
MSHSITVFLGAGASKAFGLPLTYEIFPIFWKKLYSPDETFHGDQRRLLKALFRVLYPGLTPQSRSKDFPNITEVLSLVDHFIHSEGIPVKGFLNQDLMNARKAIEIGIVSVIEEDFHVYSRRFKSDRLYDAFLQFLISKAKKNKVNIISTNYDILIEYGLFYDAFRKDKNAFIEQVDFGLRWRDPLTSQVVKYNPPANPTYSIYKLHGSTNWLSCEMCGQLYINIYGSIYNQINIQAVENTNTCHCGHFKLSSVIVSPSVEREVKDPHVKYVWNAALESLRTSEEWIIAGYSLPSEDLNIRSILTRAFVGHKSKPKITIVQKGNSTQRKYKQLFGKVDYIDGGMEGFLQRQKQS